MGEIKMIAVDLDGTLLRDDCSISERNRLVLQDVINNGYLVVPTSGRCFVNASRVLNMFHGLRYFVNANGTVLTDADKGQVIYQHALSAATTGKLFTLIEQFGSFMELYEGMQSHVACDAREQLMRLHMSDSYADNLLFTCDRHESLRQWIGEPGREIVKFHVISESEKKCETLKQQARETLDVYPISSFPQNMEVVRGHWNKADGLQKLTELLQIAADDVMVLGDSENDLEMLKWAGVSVAMENAPAMVKAQAGEITASNEADGVALALERLL